MITQQRENYIPLQRLRLYTANIFKKAAQRLDRRITITNPETQLKLPNASLNLICDFNDHVSPGQCQDIAQDIYHKNNTIYEGTNIISDVSPYNITHGAYIIYQKVKNLQHHGIQNGVFVGVVDPGVGSKRQGIVVTTEEGYTFVGPDNGLFSPVLSTLTIKDTYKIIEDAFPETSRTFHGRDQFTPIGARIASGENPLELMSYGDNKRHTLEKIDPKTLIKRNFAVGQVVELDGYNVKIWQKGIPTRNGEKAKSLTIKTPRLFRRRGIHWSHNITIPVVNTFADVPPGHWLAYEGSSGRTKEDNIGLIEIAINQGHAKNRLNVHIGETLRLIWNYNSQSQ